METVEQFKEKINLYWTGSASELNSETEQKKVIQQLRLKMSGFRQARGRAKQIIRCTRTPY
jgi:hypothetical protein